MAFTLLSLCLLSLQLAHPVFGAAPPYGQLSVSNGQVVGSSGQAVILRGMSLFWSSFSEGSPFYTADVVKQLKCNWNANLVRAAMGVEEGSGYLSNQAAQLALVQTVIQAAIDNGIYVIVDWHDHNAQNHKSQAISFFQNIARQYGSNPNIIYETFNEPLQVDRASVVKPYHVDVVAAIRAIDSKNIIVLGTPTWSQDVDVAANNPVSGSNLCYTLHYYAATHKQSLRDKATAALNKKVCVFVTEYGTVSADGNGGVDSTSSQEWWTFSENNKISYANWAVDAKSEGSAALNPGTSPSQVGSDSVLTASGKLVKAQLVGKSNGVSCSGGGGGATTTTTKAGGTTTTTKATTTTKSSGGGGGSATVSASISVTSTWNGGGQFSVVIKNTGSKAVCKVVFKINLASGQTISGIWNADGSSPQYSTPSWMNLAAGATYQDTGFTVSGGSATPSVTVVSATAC
uniref:Endoglucanase n=1 Tax=Pratylenchus coffeae TaxID=45937 RepID=B6CH67_PRACF|nr:GHF5 endoglucanase precursor [Pratylenchus coffeae]